MIILMIKLDVSLKNTASCFHKIIFLSITRTQDSKPAPNYDQSLYDKIGSGKNHFTETLIYI